ncbi:MAG: TolC family outer membrane protein [Sphingomonadales bacterium]|nr:TolC family outer membrane protein [Sphingomonadales bacterium]MDE2168527.1 TolC family outer membrane protein [Sphingomonadales bacterium]
MLAFYMSAPPAHADDLLQALAKAYASNPDIQEARARTRAQDEGVQIARAPGLPSLQAVGRFSRSLLVGTNNTTLPTRTLSGEVDASVPVYEGGAIRNATLAAKQRVYASRKDLTSTESAVFANVVQVYLGVIHDETVVQLNRKNVEALEINLKATTARFQRGDLTRTDVAQSRERLSLAKAVLQTAQVQLAASREKYVAIVGSEPVALSQPPGLTGLPASVADAINIAIDNNPDLASAKLTATAYAYDAKVAKAGRAPKVQLFGNFQYDNYFDTYGGYLVPYYSQYDKIAAVGVQVTVPIFQGGLPAAQQRQADAERGAALEHATSVERQVIQGVRSAFLQWRASNGIIAANQSAVEAAGQSLAGVRTENKIGDRTIIDILNAEQELLSAQVQLVSAQRDAYIAAFNLLTAMGRSTAGDLGLTDLYDPQVHYHAVSGSIWDWGATNTRHPVATSTRQIPAQTGEIGPKLP